MACSDMEKALILAIMNQFKTAILVFCKIHLKKCLYRHLHLELKLPKGQIRQIRAAIFGKIGGDPGIMGAVNESDFNQKKIIFKNKFRTEYESDGYLEEFLGRVLSNLLNPQWTTDIVDLTNNDAEAMNHVLGILQCLPCKEFTTFLRSNQPNFLF